MTTATAGDETRTAEPGDAWLLRQYAAGGSPEAFAQLVRRYDRFVFATALRQARSDRALAEDVTQAVFIVLARRAGSVRANPSLAGFLYQTTIYAARDAVRAKLRRQRHERNAAVDPAAAVDPSADPVAASDEAIALDRALCKIPPRDRQLLLLHYFDGLTVAETAQQLAITAEAARKRLHRALDRLRQRLEAAGCAMTAPAVTTALVQIVRPPVSAAPATSALTATAAAAADDGGAFTIAHSVLRSLRLAAIGKAAAGVAVVAVVAGGVAITTSAIPWADQRASAQSTAPASTAPAPRPATPAAPGGPTAIDYVSVFTNMQEAKDDRAALERQRQQMMADGTARARNLGKLVAARDALPKDSPQYAAADQAVVNTRAANAAADRAAQREFDRTNVRQMAVLFQKIEVAVTEVGKQHGLSLPAAASPAYPSSPSLNVGQLRAIILQRFLPRPAGAPDLTAEALRYVDEHPNIQVPGLPEQAASDPFRPPTPPITIQTAPH